MKRKRKPLLEEPAIPGLRAALADVLAEALMCHPHRCVARLAAQHQLRLMGLSETEFLARWAGGAYDADL